jgi:uncharacterized membrane protein
MIQAIAEEVDARRPACEQPSMNREPTSSTRLEAFSDGVIAIIITIMVLDLRAPVGGGAAALVALWPVFLSYLSSFFVVAIYWMNHHRIFHVIKHVDNAILWFNIVLLFFLSLVPFATAYMGENQMSALPVALYCAVLMVCGLAFSSLRVAIARHFGGDTQLQAWNRAAARKNWFAVAVYAAGIPLAFFSPALSLVLVFGNAAIYFLPNFGVPEP